MKTKILSVFIFLSSFASLKTCALRISNITCSGTTLHDVRVKGCSEEPCTIKKGQPLPFEVDLSFSTPGESADDVYFNVYIPKYAKRPAVHGSSLITATCDQGGLGFDCPVNPDTIYTLRSHLLIDPESVCTGNCQFMGPNGTGIRVSKWRWTITDRRTKSRRKDGKAAAKQHAYSACQFKLPLNIVE